MGGRLLLICVAIACLGTAAHAAPLSRLVEDLIGGRGAKGKTTKPKARKKAAKKSRRDTVTDTVKTESAISGKCTIIFDFDGVIKVYQDQYNVETSVGAEAKEVVTLVRERALDMGVATMSCENGFISGYLKDTIDKEIFSDEFLSSERFQFCEPKKSIQMAKIISHFAGDPNCAILYDDSIGNQPDVEGAGYAYQWMDRSIGITQAIFEQGLDKLRSKEDCMC
ncbi:hypothetical protein BSKO_02947 [Bryopsis sp. KO-2023]|nr:hypothetical protein BSKO_02947 [Bryopsis sp. KO-2023]